MGKPRKLPRLIDGVALFEQATASSGLMRGFERMFQNQGAAGGDGITLEAFAQGLGERLAALSHSLREGSYRPKPLRSVNVPKKAGGLRTLTIPSVVDRVAQSSVAQLLQPALDREMEEDSYGYRAGRSVADAVKRVERLRREGFVYTVDADIDDFFDTIPIDGLVDRLGRSITESPLIELIALWLEHGAKNGRGIAQGSPLSPVLANLYLDDLDESLARGGLRIVRYADDFVVLTRDRPGAEAALTRIQRLLANHGLTLDPQKTGIRSYDDGLRFLGHLFVRGWAMKAPEDELPADFVEALKRVAENDRAAARIAAEEEETNEGERRAGLDRGLRLLHVREPGRKLSLRNESFAVHEAPEALHPGESRELAAVHPSRVDRIEIGPNALTDVETLKHALASGIPVAFVNGHGEALGHLCPVLQPRASRHLAQARHALDPALRIDLARRLVEGRLANQRSLLRRVNYRRGLAEVAAAAARIGMVERKAKSADAVDNLMGIEGEATKLYWRAYSSLLLHGFDLASRKRRASEDPINIALDVACGLLARDIGAILLSVGLHPGFGVLHTSSDGRDACVYDLMEEFRAGLAESLVLTLINTGALTQENFQQLPSGELRLMRAGMTTLIRGYEDRAERPVTSVRSGRRVTWRRLMREQAEAYAAHIEAGRNYRPYVLSH